MPEPTNATQLRVVVASASEDLCRLIEERDPRIKVVRDHDLLPPMRHPGDHGGDPDFSRDDDQQRRFDELVDSADALYGLPDEDPAALRRAVGANSGLRWVHTTAAGGGAAVKAAGLSDDQLSRVTFTTSAGVHGGPLAEFAVFGVLAGAKDLPRLQRQQADGVWSDRWTMRQLAEMTVLVVGLGGIGVEVARRLDALGATVIGARRGDDPVPHVQHLVRPDRLADVVGEVDAIVITLPGTAATEKLINAEVLAAVRPDTILVNVGRGTVIDEEALLPALTDGRISLAVLDVFATEPLPVGSPLWALPNVIISPHTAALNAAEDRRIAELFADNAVRLLDAEPLVNVVDTVDFYRRQRIGPGELRMRAGSAVIIGGGVAGLATARGLLDAGWQVQLFDRGEPDPRVDTAFGLWPQAWAVIERCGAAEVLSEIAERPDGGALLDPDGRVLIRPRRIPDVRLAPRTRVIDALRSALPPGVCVEREAAIEDLPEAELLIGADGIHSRVRELISPVRARPVGSVAWRGTLPGHPELPAETWGDGLLFGVTPGGAGRTNWFGCARTARSGAREADQAEVLRDLFGGWHPGVADVLDRLEQSRIDRRTLMEVPHLSTLVGTPASGPAVALVGDAAHAMAPNLGRGACEGLLDAAALVDCLDRSADLPDALARYNRRRRRRSATVRRASRMINTISTTTTGWRVRNRVFGLVGRVA